MYCSSKGGTFSFSDVDCGTPQRLKAFLFQLDVYSYFSMSGVFSGFSNERFGQNGKFLCRCADGDTCADDGTCTACAHGWEGHKCQIGRLH